MEIVVDQLFKDTFESYYRNQTDSLVLHEINDTFNIYDVSLICDTVNMIKTGMVLGLTYTNVHDRTVKKILDDFPVDSDIDLFILNVTMKVMISMGSTNIMDFICKARDIHAEVTAKYFRVQESKVTEDMVKEVLSASDKFTKKSYSVEEPPVASWDEYFYDVCISAARNSKCLSRRIGAVLVMDKSIISTGYNGPPRGIPRCDLRWYIDEEFNTKYSLIALKKSEGFKGKCPRRAIGCKTGEGLEICVAGHAERNALINAAREGIATKGCTLYMSCGIPCTPCLVEIINAGVKEIVVTSLKVYDESSMYLLKQSSLEIRLFNFIKNK